MRLRNVGHGWNVRSGVARLTFFVPVVACWLMLLFSRAGHRLHDVGAGMVLVASFWIIWAGFVAWRVAMNEHVAATDRTPAGVKFRHRRH